MAGAPRPASKQMQPYDGNASRVHTRRVRHSFEQRRLVLGVALISLLCVRCLAANQPCPARPDASDPFAPFLTASPPVVVKNLGEITTGGVKLRRVVFLSRTVKTFSGNVRSEVFAVIARPAEPGRYPGLLVLHGGRGKAEEARAVAWAARGYVVVAPDVPGIADPDAVPYSNGPWKGRFEHKYISASPDVTASPIFDGALAALQAFYLLRSQPDVDPARLGVTGVSWGGYMATMVAGLAGKDVRAVFSAYGSGFYDRGSGWQERLQNLPRAESDAWLKYLDAGRRASSITAYYFIAAATNDQYFWPPSVTATLDCVRGDKNQLFAPNAAREAPVPGGSRPLATTAPTWLDMEVEYFAYQLKGEGSPLPVVVTAKPPRQRGVMNRVYFHAQGRLPVVSARVYYSYDRKPWAEREWVEVPAASLGGGLYAATLPAPAAGNGLHWFALVSDARPVTVSGKMEELRAP